MKHQLKKQHWMPAALAGLALSATVAIGAPTINVNTYDTSSSVNGDWSWYGGATLNWDGTQDHTDGTGGSLHISHAAASGDHIYCAEAFSGNTWDSGTTHDLTLYTNMSLWVKWDTNNSTMSISDFNANLGGMGINLNDNAGGRYGSWSGSNAHGLPGQQIPNGASNGWVHLNFPISSTLPNIDQIGAFEFNNYHSVPWSGDVAFWVDDITFQPAAVDVVPAPIVKGPFKTVTGLNVYASTQGSLYDRQSARLRQAGGLTWVGQATAANPVTYSLTIKSFPSAPATYGCEGYLFLIANPTSHDNAPDYNQSSCVVAYVDQGSTSATLHFQYKVNDGSDNSMQYGNNSYTNKPGSWDGVTPEYRESGNLGSVSSAGSAVGTWTIKFTSDTNLTLIAPDGSTTNLIFPIYNTSYFVENTGFDVYLGMQANNTATINQAVVYGSFSISNTASPYSENFAAETALDTTNIWDTSIASGAAGVLIVPASAAYWINWSLPAAGYSLQTGTNLTQIGAWNSPASGPVLTLLGAKSQLISSSDLPAGQSAYFNLVKRSFTQLLTLLPGETLAPGTVTGKTGTPTDVNANDAVNVTVYSVDATFHPVSSSDAIDLTSIDSSATLPLEAPLVNGQVTLQVYFGSAGSQTVTATDAGNTGIPANTSSVITVH